MNTYESLKNDLIQLGIRPTDVIKIHSSMKKIGDTFGGGDTVLDVFCDYLGDAGMVILPCHTWGNIQNYDYTFHLDIPSNLGLLPNLFRIRKNVHRSLHPTHSVCAFGKKAEAFVQDPLNHVITHPKTSCYGKLMDYNAKILLIGVTLTSNTFFHFIEEQFFGPVPHWYTTELVDFFIKLPDGTVVPDPLYCSKIVSSEYFDRAMDAVLQEPSTVTGKFGQADCILMDCQKIYPVITKLLAEHPRIFLDEKV